MSQAKCDLCGEEKELVAICVKCNGAVCLGCCWDYPYDEDGNIANENIICVDCADVVLDSPSYRTLYEGLKIATQRIGKGNFLYGEHLIKQVDLADEHTQASDLLV